MEKKEGVSVVSKLRDNRADTLCLHLTYNVSMFSCEADKIFSRFPAGVQN